MITLRNRRIKSNNYSKRSWDGIPATVRKTLREESLYKSIFASLSWHLKGAFLIWLIFFLFMFFGITPKLLPKPEIKIKDIEFIIKTPHSQKTQDNRTEAEQSAIISKKTVDVEPKNKNNNNNSPSKIEHKKITQQKSHSNENNSKISRQTGKNSKIETTSKTEIPDFSLPMPSLKSMSSGLNGSNRTTHRVSGIDNSDHAGILGSSSNQSTSNAHSTFDKDSTRGKITTYDISPYVNELKRNLRWNWKPVNGYGNKRVELFLRIAKDGRIIILNVKRTSEVGEVDNAALNAVRKCTPLDPLPSKYAKTYLDLVFTFDANSINSSY